MNTLQKILALFSILLGFTSGLNAQEYKDQLAPIYIKVAKNQQLSTNSFTALHRNLIGKNDFKFSREIKQAAIDESILVFFSENNFFTIDKTEYLKLIRKAANRSEDVSEFTSFLKERLPKIEAQLESDSSLKQLFEIAQQHTLHGKLHELPEFYAI